MVQKLLKIWNIFGFNMNLDSIKIRKLIRESLENISLNVPVHRTGNDFISIAEDIALVNSIYDLGNNREPDSIRLMINGFNSQGKIVKLNERWPVYTLFDATQLTNFMGKIFRYVVPYPQLRMVYTELLRLEERESVGEYIDNELESLIDQYDLDLSSLNEIKNAPRPWSYIRIDRSHTLDVNEKALFSAIFGEDGEDIKQLHIQMYVSHFTGKTTLTIAGIDTYEEYVMFVTDEPINLQDEFIFYIVNQLFTGTGIELIQSLEYIQ